MRERVLYFMNAVSSPVITALRSLSKGRRVTEVVIDQAHHIISQEDARLFCPSVLAAQLGQGCQDILQILWSCQTTKASTMRPKGLLLVLLVLCA